MKSLFGLSESILELEAELERDDLTDEERARAVDDWLSAQGIAELEASAEARATEAKRLQLLAAADANRAASLKERLKSYFQAHDLNKFKTDRYNISLQANGGKLPVILEVEPEQLPEAFHRVIPARIEADRDAIRAALESAAAARANISGRFDRGEIDEESFIAEMAMIPSMPGARLGERAVSIRIR